MTPNLNDLQPGQTVVYATALTLAGVKSEAKNTAWLMYLDGKADLTQKKLPDGRFEYRITARSLPPTSRELLLRHQYYDNLSKKDDAA
jgi:hypothetical protein